MINLADCIEIGQFTRSHGYKGQLILKLRGVSFEEITEMEWVFVVIDGLPVPFFIEEYTERSSDSFITRLENINSIEDGEELIGQPAYLSKSVISNNAGSFASLKKVIGYNVIDTDRGHIGNLDDVIDNPQNPLVSIKKNRQEILLPLQEEFIVSIDDKKEEITVSCPPGLIDVFN